MPRGPLGSSPFKLVYYHDQPIRPTVPGDHTQAARFRQGRTSLSSGSLHELKSRPSMPIAIQNAPPASSSCGYFGFASTAIPLPKTSRCWPPCPTPSTPLRPLFSKSRWLRSQAPPPPKTLANCGRATSRISEECFGGRPRYRQVLVLQIVYDRLPPALHGDYLADRPCHPGDPSRRSSVSHPTRPNSCRHGAPRQPNWLNSAISARHGRSAIHLAVKQHFGSKLTTHPRLRLVDPGTQNACSRAIMSFSRKYHAKAPGEGIDPLG